MADRAAWGWLRGGGGGSQDRSAGLVVSEQLDRGGMEGEQDHAQLTADIR